MARAAAVTTASGLITYFLEMTARPAAPRPAAPCSGVTIAKVESISAEFYRYLYGRVGAPWQWIDRAPLTDRALQSIIGHPKVEIHVLYLRGEPIGFVELDGRSADEIEIAYFGLMPAAIGRGLGAYFLSWAVEHAFAAAISRLWVHTCSLDHPRALAAYQRAGFVLYDTVTTSRA